MPVPLRGWVDAEATRPMPSRSISVLGLLRSRKSLEGLSLRTLFWNAGSELILFAYLVEEKARCRREVVVLWEEKATTAHACCVDRPIILVGARSTAC